VCVQCALCRDEVASDGQRRLDLPNDDRVLRFGIENLLSGGEGSDGPQVIVSPSLTFGTWRYVFEPVETDERGKSP
jgi:hypothetical protein